MSGRNGDCTPELIQKIYHHIRTGVSRESAAILSGIGKSTLYKYMSRGEAGEAPYVEFVEAVDKAESELEQELIECWKQSCQLQFDENGKVKGYGDWRATDALLKRKRPKNYSDQTYLNIDQELIKGATELEKLEKLANEIINQIAGGKISADSGAIILKTLDDRRKLIETVDHEQRIKATEEALKQRGA
jgi:hypothetical protein